MIKENIKNISISVVVVVLIVGGIFYIKNNSLKKETSITPEQNVENTSKENIESSNATEKPSPEFADKEKFNTAMTNGSNAFVKGEYQKSLDFYEEALGYKKSDTVYAHFFTVYGAQNNIDKARIAIDTAISLNPSYTDYWIWKIVFLDEKTTVSYLDLEKVYQDGMKKVDNKTKVNLVTAFARVAENNAKKSESIILWQKAIELHPESKVIYQTEIDRLK